MFTVLFRGAFMTEAGIEYLLEAANALKHEPVRFRIIGSGLLAPVVDKMIRELELNNVEWIKERLPWDELIAKMQECHLSIGQNSDNKRQKVQVAFKTVESMALKIPQIIALNSEGILEFLTDKVTCIGVKPTDPQDLVEKILWAKNNQAEISRIAKNAYELYLREFTQEILARKMLELIKQLNK